MRKINLEVNQLEYNLILSALYFKLIAHKKNVNLVNERIDKLLADKYIEIISNMDKNTDPYSIKTVDWFVKEYENRTNRIISSMLQVL